MSIGKILLIALIVMLIIFLIFYFVILNIAERCIFFPLLRERLGAKNIEFSSCAADPEVIEFAENIYQRGGNPFPTLTKIGFKTY